MFLDVTWLDRPKLFVSSTMDKNTAAIRKEFEQFARDRGYEVIAFESNEFPYTNDHSENVIQETINAVATANLFVLLIDENYGSVVDGKSVVHREYLRAVELNIPIFTFIQKQVWNDYCHKNISADSLIHSQEHYDFIKEVAEYKISEYETASECFDHLNLQLLNFLGGSLKFSSKANWLWNESYTRTVESNAKEVWIITPDFLWDFDDIEFHRIVVDNVTTRGCKYRYIFLGTKTNIDKRDEMIRFYKRSFQESGKDPITVEDQVQFISVTPKNFFWSNEQILFDPFSLEEKAIMVDVMDVRDRTRKFNVEFGHGKRVNFRQQFIEYWNKNQKDNRYKIIPNNY